MQNQNLDPERRTDKRVEHRGYGSLYFEESSFECHLLDVSLRGAKVAILEPHDISFGKEISLRIDLGNEKSVLLQGQIAHVKEHIVGIVGQPLKPEDQATLEALVKE